MADNQQIGQPTLFPWPFHVKRYLSPRVLSASCESVPFASHLLNGFLAFPLSRVHWEDLRSCFVQQKEKPPLASPLTASLSLRGLVCMYYHARDHRKPSLLDCLFLIYPRGQNNTRSMACGETREGLVTVSSEETPRVLCS